MIVTRVDGQARAPYVPVVAGVEVSRSISDARVGTLGGGHLRWTADASFEGTLDYDEALFVISGQLSIAVGDHVETGYPGDILLLDRASTATYSGVAGTELIYVMSPRP